MARRCTDRGADRRGRTPRSGPEAGHGHRPRGACLGSPLAVEFGEGSVLARGRPSQTSSQRSAPEYGRWVFAGRALNDVLATARVRSKPVRWQTRRPPPQSSRSQSVEAPAPTRQGVPRPPALLVHDAAWSHAAPPGRRRIDEGSPPLAPVTLHRVIGEPCLWRMADVQFLAGHLTRQPTRLYDRRWRVTSPRGSRFVTS